MASGTAGRSLLQRQLPVLLAGQLWVELQGALSLFFFFLTYLFLAASGLRCCAWAFSSCGERGLLFVAVRGLLMAVASLVAEHGL